MDKCADEILQRNEDGHGNCLNLSHRQLTILPLTFGLREWLKTVLLNSNQLLLPPVELITLAPNLTELILDDNQLTVIPADIKLLKSLKVLSANKNNIGTLPVEIGDLCCLEQLWLNECHLVMLPKELGNLRSLRHIGMRNNYLQVLPTEFLELNNLTWINCSHNKLTEFPNINKLQQLKFLNLDCNQIDALPSHLEGAEQLRVLLLRGNHLTLKCLSDDLLLALCNVVRLDLRDNSIDALPRHWKGMSQILFQSDLDEEDMQQTFT